MALEIKLRVRSSGGNARGRDVAVFVSLDGRQSQLAGTIILSDEELEALRVSAALTSGTGTNGDILLTSKEGE